MGVLELWRHISHHQNATFIFFVNEIVVSFCSVDDLSVLVGVQKNYRETSICDSWSTAGLIGTLFIRLQTLLDQRCAPLAPIQPTYNISLAELED